MNRLKLSSAIDRQEAVASALRTLSTERTGLNALIEAMENGLGEIFAEAASVLAAVKGRVIVTGVGKSGHIGSKLAATFASTGTPAYFVHPAEANHGDLGMITSDDAIIAISWSGETEELKGIVAYSRRFSIPLIALTAGTDSALGREADVVVALPRTQEACPHGLAPTTSTLLQLAMGDALAIALLEARGFTPDHFRTFHPGGQLGASLVRIGDVMHVDERVPLIGEGSRMRDAILEMTRKGFGCVGIVNPAGDLTGIITDGDIRRHIDSDLLAMSVDQVMTRSPRVIGPNDLAAVALSRINTSAITALMVVEAGKPVGIVHLHDLLRIGAA
ncbi:KpsF/GutQ family sugar-phosphate isomerase [Zhengella mangrovi]|uniref:KpsF/GutQ family sugar-phosphate isomerase n=1 Tax=Zhengella mangrovi TaxID=1982044 RepID=A0A2G1QNY0_9HYPH|nr:KpsF/GutQ family sugar-phosphate isomerase [Zhengella mangrovi]PHP67236.1 KpsF/GutQ family sugar-phosphate isomerase [Zhengella mangrovi]